VKHFSTTFTNKADVESCTDYRGIKLMSHIKKLWEMIIEQCLRGVTNITENQFGFMLGRSTMEAIFHKAIYGEIHGTKKDLHMVFIDLETI
jgi:hypothetical protein